MTHTLPFDYARCGNTDCPLRGECLRALAKGHPTYQVQAMFPGGKDCHGLINAPSQAPAAACDSKNCSPLGTLDLTPRS